MPYIDDHKYDSLAKDAVDSFLTHDVPLSDSVYKYASDNGMLPDQVKQLVWRTNTLAHLTLFEKKAEDKVVDFTVADAANVLSRLYQTTETKTASAYADSVLDRDIDFFSPLNPGEEPVEDTTKVAAFDTDYAVDTDTRRDDSIFTLRKVAAELEYKVLQARDTYVDSVEQAVDTMRKLACNPLRAGENAEVICDICSEHGSAGMAVLADMNVNVPQEFAKLAGVADTSHELYTAIQKAIRSKEAALNAVAAIKLLKDKLGGKY